MGRNLIREKLLVCLSVLTLSNSAQARLYHQWSDAELQKGSDLIVVGAPIAVKDLDETSSLGRQAVKFRGVETTFRLIKVLKGKTASEKIVLHHYRFTRGIPVNGPEFVAFAPNKTKQYQLFLVKDGRNVSAPVTGQIDPYMSVKPSDDARLKAEESATGNH